ncbi:flagellar hook-length control protein FliK [Pseudomonas japonica]|uniref:flagellar hook-length control protein FliK n=1 Tax=Pseudomonas japonica TaxID=256466 RepID=UPI0015E313FB|nr:flagellar hook-length control protein FliK [Pseudomonas japonica]MBA1291102.1 flagellar hook-length control protein FliK [Pseudomonas japonica]
MTNEISAVAAAANLAATSRSAAISGELLKLLQSVDGLLEPGQTAKAEVLSIKQLPGDFQLLLKLTLDSGRQATVQVGAAQPLAIGTPLLVTRMLSEQLSVSLAGAPRTGLTQLDTSRLPVGTLLQGKVVTSLPVAGNDGPPVYRAMVTLLNSALAGQTLTIESPQPLRIGSLLSAQVQGSQALSVVQLGGRLDELAVAQQISTQSSRQASLQSLLAVIQASQSQNSLPPEVRARASALLAAVPDMADLQTPDALAKAFNNSGLFLESGLLTGSLEAPEADLKGALLRLVAQILPNLPGNQPPNPATLATMALAAPGFLRNALGILGQVGPRSQEAPAFPLASRTLQKGENEDDLHSLLRLASAALSRVQTHQLASLEQASTGPHGLAQHSWQLEIPMRAFNDIVPMQVRVQAQDEPNDKERELERDAEGNPLPLRKVWRLDLAFDLPRLGPLHVQAQLFNSNLSSQVWAENPATVNVVQRELPWFRERLMSAGLTVGELDCHIGRPPQGNRTRLEQRWVDETA